MSIKTVPVETNVDVSITAPIQHLCPFVNEVDNGTVTIGWATHGWTFELHSLRDYLGTFADREISHEALTQEIRDELSGHHWHGILRVSVSSEWRTAGMRVGVQTRGGGSFSTLPTHAAPQ
jgi:NADPH-dependent 7-cyano-7-deazaguanine reductase QueF